MQGLIADVHRLLEAGGQVAAGDEGLRRREQALRGLAAKVPALAVVAEGVSRVCQAPPAKAPAALCDLLVLTRQLQASLVQAGLAGKMEAVAKSGPWQSAASSRDVLAWAQASFYPNSNDAKTMKIVVSRPDFADLRLVQPLLGKLNTAGRDEKNDLLADQALPAFGPALLPELQGGLNPKGKTAHARRLHALCRIDPRQGQELCRKVLAEGSPEVKVQAVREMGRFAPAEAEQAALELLAGKIGYEAREGALQALAFSKRDEALEVLLQASFVKDYTSRIAQKVLYRLPHPRTTERLLQALEEKLADLAALRSDVRSAARGKGGSQAAQKVELLEKNVNLIEVLGLRQDAKAVPPLKALLKHPEANVREAAINALISLRDTGSLEVAADLISDRKMWESAVKAAYWLPSKPRFDRLAPLLDELSKAKKADRRRAEHLLSLFEAEMNKEVEDFDDSDEKRPELCPARTDWDPRWAPLLRKHLHGPVCADAAIALAVVLREKAIPDLLPLLEPSVKKGECGVVEALGFLKARAAIPVMVPLILGQQAHHYCIHDALRRINDPAAIPLLEELLGKTKDSYRMNCITAVIDFLQKNATAP